MSKSYKSNLQLCHAYVHQLTEAGRSSNMSYEAGTLFSYKTPIAARIGNTIILTTETFSQTTSRHKRDLVSSAAQVCEVVLAKHIPILKHDEKHISVIHNLNVEYFLQQLHAAMDSFLKTTRSRIKKARDLIKVFDDIDTYTHVFNLDWDKDQLVYQTLNQAKFEIATHNDRDRLEIEKRNLQGSDLFKSYDELVEESYLNWKSGKTNKPPMLRLTRRIALRITKDRIETSRDASMPKSDAEKVWPNLKAMWQSCLRSDNDVMVKNDRLRFGHFRGVKVTKNFIRIGCHTIPWSEVVDIAKQLGLDTTGVEDDNTKH